MALADFHANSDRPMPGCPVRVEVANLPLHKLLAHVFNHNAILLTDSESGVPDLMGVESRRRDWELKDYVSLRDGYRRERGAEPLWGLCSYGLALDAAKGKGKGVSGRKRILYWVFDKLGHGRNRGKGKEAIDGDFDCPFCQEGWPDSQEHISRLCRDPQMVGIRDKGLAGIAARLHAGPGAPKKGKPAGKSRPRARRLDFRRHDWIEFLIQLARDGEGGDGLWTGMIGPVAGGIIAKWVGRNMVDSFATAGRNLLLALIRELMDLGLSLYKARAIRVSGQAAEERKREGRDRLSAKSRRMVKELARQDGLAPRNRRISEWLVQADLPEQAALTPRQREVDRKRARAKKARVAAVKMGEEPSHAARGARKRRGRDADERGVPSVCGESGSKGDHRAPRKEKTEARGRPLRRPTGGVDGSSYGGGSSKGGKRSRTMAGPTRSGKASKHGGWWKQSSTPLSTQDSPFLYRRGRTAMVKEEEVDGPPAGTGRLAPVSARVSVREWVGLSVEKVPRARVGMG